MTFFDWIARIGKRPDHAESAHHDQERTREEIQRATDRIVSELQQVSAAIERGDAARQQSPRIEKWKLAAEILTLAVVLAYTAVSYCLLRTTSKALNEAVEANRIARAAKRPWVGVEIVITRPLQIDKDAASVEIPPHPACPVDADVEHILGQPQFCFGTAAQRKKRGKPRQPHPPEPIAEAWGCQRLDPVLPQSVLLPFSLWPPASPPGPRVRPRGFNLPQTEERAQDFQSFAPG